MQKSKIRIPYASDETTPCLTPHQRRIA
jgi:hypothetical protein